MRVLVLKTTSMGDIVHAMPALTDMRARVPGLEVDWLVEAPFAAIPRMHPGVRRVLPMAWRKWRKRLFARETWQAIGALRRDMQRERYDLVLDLQGLTKSALWGLMAKGPLAGYDHRSGRDPFAPLFYRRKASVSLGLHAVERCRRLAAAHLGYAAPDDAPDFGLVAPPASWQAPAPFAVLVPNASRPEKLWPQERWIAVGRHLHENGRTPVVMWGSKAEQHMAEDIASACSGVVPPFLTVAESAAVLAQATVLVGLDTGFSHLGAAFGVPTVGIYCDYEPGLAGITGSGRVASIGGVGAKPALDDVLALIDDVTNRGPG